MRSAVWVSAVQHDVMEADVMCGPVLSVEISCQPFDGCSFGRAPGSQQAGS